MAGEFETTLKILGELGSVSLAQLSSELAKRDALGYGLRVIRLVEALRNEGLVDYDPEKEVVSLHQQEAYAR